MPCQPFSVAGRQKGTKDNRHLWPEMFRIIQDFSAQWIIIENVRGLINIQDGVVFERVHADLANEGYETQSFIIPASGVGAPHRRERVWIVGYSEHHGLPSATQSRSTSTTSNNNTQGKDKTWKSQGTSRSNNSEVMENSRRTIRGQQSTRNKESTESGTSQETKWSADSDSVARSSEREKIMANTESIQSNVGKINQFKKESGETRIFRGEVGRVSSSMANADSDRKKWSQSEDRQGSRIKQDNWWNIEPDVGRVADGVQGRTHRLKGLGNAIVPQIAEEIGRAILKAEYEN